VSKVSVICPTIREKGLDIVKDALDKQTFRDFTWIVCSPFEYKGCDTWIKDDFEGGFWGLNRAYNALFKACSGDIVVSWQDFVWADKDALAKFVANVTEFDSVVSGVGDQYARLGEYGKPEVKIWSDPRKTNKYGSFYESQWNDAEFNFCAFPLWMAKNVGGFDEQLDFLGVGGDQLQFCERLNDMGIKFFLDQTNESYTLRHGREDFGGENAWNEKHVLFKLGKSGRSLYDERKRELMTLGQWPELPYLDRV